MNEKVCSKCGKPNPADMNFCLDCGQKLPAMSSNAAAAAASYPETSVPTMVVPANKQPNFQPPPPPTAAANLNQPPPLTAAAPKKSRSGLWLAVIGGIGLIFVLLFAGGIALLVMNWDKIAADEAELRPANSNSSSPAVPPPPPAAPRASRNTNINAALPEDSAPTENRSLHPPAFDSDSNDTAAATEENKEPAGSENDASTTGTTPVVFDDLWVEYDVIENDQTGMRIHTKFTVNNLKDVDSYLAVYFETRDGKRLKDKNRKFFSAEGDVAVYRSLKPDYDVAVYDDLTVFMPYAELDLKKGDYKLRMDVDIIHKEGGMIQHLDIHDFDFTF